MTMKINMMSIVEHKSFCSLPMTKLIINSEGDVSQCCYQLEQIGNIFEDDLLTLWNSDKTKEIRATTMQGNLHPQCSSWNVCPYLVQEKTLHSFHAYQRFSYPTWVEIDLPDTHCNIGGTNPSEENPACIMCIRNHRKPQQKDHTELMCEKVKPLMPYLKHICVLGIAEPFWKNKAFEILDKLDFPRYKDQIRFETNTNGLLLTPKIVEKFFHDINWSDVSFSLDAATPETFMKIRRIDAFNQIVDNIKNYVNFIDEHTMRDRHIVKIWNNINLLNVSEMVPMVEMAHDLNVERLIMLPTHDQNGNVSLGELLINKKNLPIFAKNADLAMKRANELGLHLLYAKPFDKIPPPVLNSRIF